MAADMKVVAGVVAQQRNQAMDMVAQLNAELVAARGEIEERDREIAALKAGKRTRKGKVDGGGA